MYYLFSINVIIYCFQLPRFFKRGTKSSKRGTDTKGETSNNTNVTNTCYQQLVSCCKRLAEESGMKPHHIFADVTLRQMADKLPMTREEMLDIEGVTEYKMDKFGQQFLEVCITNNCHYQARVVFYFPCFINKV